MVEILEIRGVELELRIMEHELAELRVTNHLGGQQRRWYRSANLDLLVWISWWGWGSPTGFQLVYDKAGRESMLTWTSAGGFVHQREDDGERNGRPGLLRYYDKATSQMVTDDQINIDRLTMQFEGVASSLPPKIAALVMDKLSQLKSPAELKVPSSNSVPPLTPTN